VNPRAATVHSHRRCPEFSSTVLQAIFVIFKCCCICLDTVVFWFTCFFWLFCKHVIMGEKIVKRNVCVCISFFFMLLNYKNQNQKDRIEGLIWIWLNISRINKIMLYFPWKCKNMFLHIFWDLIIDLLKP
jgi:hypothetical protein